MHKIVTFFVGLLAIGFTSSCSSDDDYSSRLPIFSDITFSSDILLTDMDIQATAVQHSKGSLIYTTTYKWSSDMPSDSTLRYSSSMNYSYNSGNPTCTFHTPNVPGTYKITFTGNYNFSGQAGNSSRSGEIPSGTATYDTYPLAGKVVLTKTFRVRQR